MLQATNLLGRSQLLLKKHSPTILLVGGVAGLTYSTVKFMQDTYINGKYEFISDTLMERKMTIEEAEMEFPDQYSAADKAKDLKMAHFEYAQNMFKLYAPTIGLGLLSLGAIFGSHFILNKRIVGMAAAYKMLDKGFAEYRDRVVEKLGEEADKEFKFGLTKEKIDVEKEGEDGKITKKKEEITVATNPSPYSIVFDASSIAHSKNPEYNKFFIKDVQEQANNKLKAQGHLFLNEVYDMLGVQRTRAGAVVGWIFNPRNENIDSCVDLGLYAIKDNKLVNEEFINGYEYNVLLDFNVDGMIYNLIWEDNPLESYGSGHRSQDLLNYPHIYTCY